MQGLRKEMEAYSNERILNNIKQQEFFSIQSVAIAKEIAVKRGLISEEKIAQFGKAATIKQQYSMNMQSVNRSATQAYRNRDSGGESGLMAGFVALLFLFKVILTIAANS